MQENNKNDFIQEHAKIKSKQDNKIIESKQENKKGEQISIADIKNLILELNSDLLKSINN